TRPALEGVAGRGPVVGQNEAPRVQSAAPLRGPLRRGICSFSSPDHAGALRDSGAGRHWFLEILGIMSDLSITLEALERSRSQLSVTSYFDEDLFRREMELIYQHGPRYVGHELSVPEVGDFHALLHEGEGRALV